MVRDTNTIIFFCVFYCFFSIIDLFTSGARFRLFGFIASSWKGYIDCNIKSGDPGFVKIIDGGIIEYPEYDGNSMYRTAGNIIKNPNVALLFVNFDGKSRRIRINGQASIHSDRKSCWSIIK